MQRLTFAYHDKTPTGDLIQRCTSDVDTIRGFLSSQLVEIFHAVAMVAIALVNRYVLVPRMQQDNRGMTLYFIWMTKLEWGIGAVVLAIVSLFATLEPF